MKNARKTIVSAITLSLLAALLLVTVYARRPIDITEGTVAVSQARYVYSGKNCCPAVTVTLGDEKVNKKDYTVSYDENREAGVATVTVEGKGTFFGTLQKVFYIKQKDISNAELVLSSTSFQYDGSAFEPDVQVTLDGKQLDENDYAVCYANNVEVGEATVTVTGVGNYTGSVSKNFDIELSGLAVAQYASSEKFLGIPYVYGGTTTNGFDCSGFCQFIYRHFGYELNRIAADQMRQGTPVSFDDLLPGDLVFFNGATHVGMYIGNGQFVHAASNSRCIVISNFSGDPETGDHYGRVFCGARRIV